LFVFVSNNIVQWGLGQSPRGWSTCFSGVNITIWCPFHNCT